MDDRSGRDPRTAARVAALRTACALPVARAHGSLAGRPHGASTAIAVEPGGRHAAVLVTGAVERWDLDLLTCVGRWPLPRDLWPGAPVCVGPTPAGLCFVAGRERWRGLAAAATLPVARADGSMRLDLADPRTPGVITMWDSSGPVLVRVADGAPLCDVPADAACWCDPDAGWVVVRRSPTAFAVLAVVAGSRTPRPAAIVEVEAARAGAAAVAIDGPGRRVAIVTEEAATIGAWDDWAAARTLPIPSGRWEALALCAGGRTLVLCAPGRVVRVDVATGRTREVAIAATRRELFAIDVASGRVLHADIAALRVIDERGVTARVHAADVALVTAAAGSPDGRVLVTSALDGALRVHDRETGELLARTRCPTREPHGVAVTPDGAEVLAVGEVDGLVRWTWRAGERVVRVALPAASELDPPPPWISADGRTAAISRRSKEHREALVYVVDLVDGRARRAVRTGRRSGMASELCLGFTADGASLRGAVFEDYGRRIEFWRLSVAAKRPEPAGGSASVTGSLLTPSSDGRLLWWERAADQEVWVTRAEPGVADGVVTRFAVAGKVSRCCAGRTLVAVQVDRTLTLLGVDGRALVTGLDGYCEPLAFAPDDRALWVRDEAGLVLELSVPAALP